MFRFAAPAGTDVAGHMGQQIVYLVVLQMLVASLLSPKSSEEVESRLENS